MKRQDRSRLVFGILLFLFGLALLAVQLFPSLRGLVQIDLSWPLWIILFAVALLVLGLLVGAHEMAIPATIVGGIGGILYWQNQTNNFGSWSYIWSLIPGFVGLGILLSGLFGGHLRKEFASGGTLILISLALFAVFGSFFGGLDQFGILWSLLIIVIGVLLLGRAFLRPRSYRSKDLPIKDLPAKQE